jgi:hypothetical protein
MTDSVVIERQAGGCGIIGDVCRVDVFEDDEYYGAPFDVAIVDVVIVTDRYPVWLYTLRAVRS